MKRAFVIAMEAEAEAIRPALSSEDRLYVAGIGKVNAAAATMKAILEFRPDIVINCGLAGGMKKTMATGETYEVEAAVEYDYDLRALNATPLGQKDERESPFIPTFAPGIFPKEKLLTGDSFSEEPTILYDAGLRDMEGAAIADVCEKTGVKCYLFKVVSDVKGLGSMVGQYEKNKAAALKILAEKVKEVVRLCSK